MAEVAVVFGNRHYDCHKPLPSCHKDAQDISKGLGSGQFPREAIWVYYDADRNTILQAINRLSEAVRRGARFTWIHFSGHGIWHRDDLYFVPSDARYFEAYVAVNAILESLSKHETERCLHVITCDCCQTVLDHEDAPCSRSGRRKNGEKIEELLRKKHSFSPSASGHELVVFCACEKYCAVPDREDPTRANPFSENVAKCLHLQNCKLGFFLTEVTRMVQEETKGRQKPTVRHISPSGYDDIITADTQADEICYSDHIKQYLERKGRSGRGLLALHHTMMQSSPQSSPRDNDRFLIVCDGTIACGKTTFLDSLSHILGIQVFREPVAKDEKNSWWPLLEDFYHDKSTEAVIQLENVVLQHHHRIATNRETNIITERSFSSSVRVFCKALHYLGTLPKSKFDQYIRDLEAMEANLCHQPTLVLYFKMPVEEALRRIKKRAAKERFFEKCIEESYLKLLEAEYETLYKNREDVVVIDIASTMSADKIKKKVADRLHDNKARYCEVLKRKGYPESQARKLLTLMISFFDN